MKVFLHLKKERDGGSEDSINLEHSFPQIPTAGDHFIYQLNGKLYQVKLVVYTPTGSGVDAEVYALEADQLQVLRRNWF